ncbi:MULTISPECIES: ferredoxin [unclassified Streptomyces]|uniref:ferredoxin n=1 Tax=unclassified Streptomyces TaxID=2593676 RepID=UPI00366364C0
MRVHIDRDRCTGSGQCAMLVPEVFDQGEDGLTLLLTEEPPEDSYEDVLQASLTCPTQVISVTD